jgi:hypothetical protein
VEKTRGIKMKIALLIAFMALGVAGCQTSSPNAGAPATEYEVSGGEAGGENINRTAATPTTNYPGGQFNRWRYPGMTTN